ncbi:MAG: hypothetical protein DRO92_04700 [Candidatus Altiarchaeales archaeon]|nr:MAG: hypothetical protein DRO92_04700 [Candidatus Altiarchaeales archaeon]
MRFKLGFKAGQLFTGHVVQSVAKAKVEMLKVVDKVSAYDYDEVHTLVHIFSYVYDAFRNAISIVCKEVCREGILTKEQLLKTFEYTLNDIWKYVERDYRSFKELRTKKGNERNL